MYGAESESEWVFINGTRLLEQKQWNIAELGFGLGTNLATVIKVRNTLTSPPPLHYIGIDHQPIPSALLLELMPQSTDNNLLSEATKLFAFCDVLAFVLADPFFGRQLSFGFYLTQNCLACFSEQVLSALCPARRVRIDSVVNV